MNRSNSFLNVLKVFPDFFSYVFELETSWSDLILSILRNSSFRVKKSGVKFEFRQNDTMRLFGLVSSPETHENQSANTCKAVRKESEMVIM